MTAVEVLGALAALQRDEDATTRRIGAALTAVVVEALDDDERAWVARIEGLRADMEASDEVLETALPNLRGVEKPLPLADVCRRRSKKRQWGTFLMVLARTLAPASVVELGTCLGISSCYLAAGLDLSGTGGLVTLEGADALAERSRANVATLGLGRVEVVSGLFVDTLDGVLDRSGPVGLAFVDGHHQEEPTLRYFAQLLQHLTDPAVVVFDDIRWSEGMEQAWERVLQDPAVRVAIDLDSIGVCVVGPPTGAPARVHRLPRVPTMQRQVSRLLPQVAPVVPPPSGTPTRLNWGCGDQAEPGWLNADIRPGPGVDIVSDIRDGLPLEDASMDCVVSVHALPMIRLDEVVGVLSELRRVLRPGGTLRLVLPDFARGVAAWQRGDADYFLVGDHDAATLSGKLITHLLWFGYSTTLFTGEFVEELLIKAGFSSVHQCSYRQTASDHAGMVDLDNREAESLFVEAVR
jgi:predicted O-methyltransferase YrrM